MVWNKPVYFRPGLRTFLQFCLDAFSVAIWSSMTLVNLDPIVDLICQASSIARTAFRFIYNQKNCEEVPGGNPKKPHIPLLTKPYYKIEVPFDPINTLFIDDTPAKGKCNGENMCISPLEYDGNPSDRFFERRLMPYLDSLAKSPLNVPEFLSEYPFM